MITITFISHPANKERNKFNPISQVMPYVPGWGSSIVNLVPKSKATYFVTAVKYDHSDGGTTVVLSDTLKR